MKMRLSHGNGGLSLAQMSPERLSASARRRAVWALWGVVYLGIVGWMALHPLSLSSDDAFFFRNGLISFSILEFSPHFPGYPGFILLGHVVWSVLDALFWALGHASASADQALFATSVLCAASLPPLLGLVARHWRGDALLAASLGLSLPFLPAVGLGMLSDGSGCAFFLIALMCLPRAPSRAVKAPSSLRPYFMFGAMLGLSFLCRPSLLVFLLATAVGGLAGLPSVIRGLALRASLRGAFSLVLPVMGGVGFREGWPLLDEALRFVSGHVSLWGNTVVSDRPHDGWIATIAELGDGPLWLAALAMALGALLIRQRWRWVAEEDLPIRGALLAAGFFGGVWTGLLQNPENLRHLLPLLLLLSLAMALWGGRLSGGILFATQVAVWLATVTPSLVPSPLGQARQVLSFEAPAVLLTNHGVAVLRQALPQQRIVDSYYEASAASVQRTTSGQVVRLTSSLQGEKPPRMVFSGRFPGEQTLYLY